MHAIEVSKGIRAGLAAVAIALASGPAQPQAPAPAVATAPSRAQPEAPKYGGTLTVGPIHGGIGALSWDPAEWVWKVNHDTGQVYEQLFAADLGKARRLGGKYPFQADAWFPADAVRGELAEHWAWQEDPLRLEVTLRRGVMFPAKPGVMAAREFTADDVVFSFERTMRSPKAWRGAYDWVEKVEATDRYTVLFTLKHFNSDWDLGLAWGYYTGIVPREVVAAGASKWKNVNGTGPFMLTDFVQGHSNTYSRNPGYWDSERIGEREYRLPFVDKLVYRTIREPSTAFTALRTGKLDILETIPWTAVEELKKHAPALKWSRRLDTTGLFLAMRVDTKPFDDIRVRRALNMAIDKRAIVDEYLHGDAELLAYPQHPDFVGYYEPLEAMPESVRELFTYNPDKARKLLAEAGYPQGFSFKVQVCACSPGHMDLAPLLAAYLEKVGVKVEIQPLEYVAFLSAMTTKTNAPGYLMASGHVNPTTAVRKNFVTGQVWNPSQYADPEFDEKMWSVYTERDERRRQAVLKALTREILDKAPYIWLPTSYLYTAWWPWVKNYGGELRAGAVRPGPIYARIWIDQELKKKMGF